MATIPLRKRLFDVAGAAAGLLAFWPVMTVVAAAIQSARAYARATAARARAEAAEARLAAARSIAQIAHECSRTGQHRELDRHLDALDRLLRSGTLSEASSEPPRLLPAQRAPGAARNPASRPAPPCRDRVRDR